MIALILDTLCSYFLSNKLRQWLYLIPLAFIVGVMISFSSNIAMHYIQPETFSKHDAVLRAFSGSLWHPLYCLACMWWFRRKKNMTINSSKP